MAFLGAAVVWGTAGVASAATAGSQSVPPITPPEIAPPTGYGPVLINETVDPTTGGVVGPVNDDGAMVSVDVPPGAFPAGSTVEIDIVAGNPAAITPAKDYKVVAAVGVGVLVNGVPDTGPFLKPLTVNVSDPKITASSVVGAWDGSTYVADTSATVSAGKAMISFDSDPAFTVEAPTVTTTTVPSATTPVTGEPFLGEGILAGLLVLGGTGGIALSRRRAA